MPQINSASSYNLNLYDIIYHAYAEVKVVGENEILTSGMYNFALARLNIMLKAWESLKGFQWKKSQAILIPTSGQHRYTVGNNTTDHISDDTVVTTLDGDGNSGDTTIIVDDVTSLSINDNIGIVLSDNTIQWTTVTLINTSTNMLTLDDALIADVSDGDNVYTYTNSAHKPLRILEVRQYRNGSEIPLDPQTYFDYMRMPNKSSTNSSQSSWHYQKKYENGLLFLYPATSDMNNYFIFDYEPSFADVILTTDNIDFPPEWTYAVMLNLSVNVAAAFGKNTGQHYADVVRKANVEFQRAFAGDAEGGYISYSVDSR